MNKQWPATLVEMRQIDTLIPYIRNARTHSDNQVSKIAASIKEFGWTIPVLVSEDSTLIAGHGRVLAAKKLGITEIPTMVARGWTESQRRAYTLTDNKLTLDGEWDDELLKIELAELKELDFNLELTGFDAKELDKLLQSEERGEIEEDETPEVSEESSVKLGDIYVLGKHRLLCGDSSNQELLKRLFAGEVPDACISDPPYGINFDTDYTRITHKTIKDTEKNYPKVKNDDQPFDPRPYLHYKSVVLFGGNYFAEHLPIGTWLVWDKRHATGTAWLSDAELAWMKGGTGVHIKAITCQGFVRPERAQHPTQKPIELMAWCMEKSNAGDLIFDPFLGSGTTLIAADKLGKRCFGCEIEPNYIEVIITRWEQLTGQKAVLEIINE